MNAVLTPLSCEVGSVFACSVAQLRLWLRRNAQGWDVATRYEAESAFSALHEASVIAEAFEWHRFVTPPSADTARLVPVLPDRPVMTRPEARIAIAPRHKGLFFVTIPVWLRVEVSGSEQHAPMALGEYPTRVLSKTWFGHPAEDGEIGYALATRARQSLDELTDVEGRAICPVLVDNATGEPLSFTQLQLRVRNMSVYQTNEGRLWTNECRLSCTGNLASAAITFGKAAPEQASGARLVSGPREIPASGLTARAVLGALFRQPL